MRKLLRWTLVTLGVVALVRWIRSRHDAVPVAPEAPSSLTVDEVDPAEELRRKLAETRADTEEASVEPDTATASVDARRADVHALGRSALSEMTPPDEG